MPFASKSADVFLTSMGYVDFQQKSVHRKTGDIVDMIKLAEAWYNRTFLITIQDGGAYSISGYISQVLRHSSEVATMDFPPFFWAVYTAKYTCLRQITRQILSIFLWSLWKVSD